MVYLCRNKTASSGFMGRNHTPLQSPVAPSVTGWIKLVTSCGYHSTPYAHTESDPWGQAECLPLVKNSIKLVVCLIQVGLGPGTGVLSMPQHSARLCRWGPGGATACGRGPGLADPGPSSSSPSSSPFRGSPSPGRPVPGAVTRPRRCSPSHALHHRASTPYFPHSPAHALAHIIPPLTATLASRRILPHPSTHGRT